MNKHKFKLLFLATVATLCSQSALAALNSYTHANGSTVININQADANGLSHNMYESFNVTGDGMVLNNSTTDLIRENGNIARNSNLDKSASLILNEVISRSPSSLNGYIEVAGQKADVIIANPNGITCSGCSFINTGRATLTTGTPTFTDGALTGFNVTKGTLTVSGNGLKGADYTDLLAQKVNIQGQIDTTQLKAIAGSYTYDLASGQATATGTNRVRGNSIDVSALGGATAGIIQLQTTEAGAGVNNSGVLNATNLHIASNGALTNSGTIQTGLMSATAGGSITNKGTISASQAAFQAMDSFTNNGTIKTSDYATIASLGKFSNSNKALIDAAGTVNIISLAGNIENNGTITTPDTLAMQTGYNTIDGAVTAVANTSLLNSGSIQAGNLSMNAVKEVRLLSRGDVTSQGTAYVSAMKVSNDATLTAQNASIVANEVRNKGVIQTSELLNVSGKNGIFNTGTMKAGTLTLATDEKISNSSCFLWVFCTKGTMSADKITIKAPKMTSISALDGTYTTPALELNKSAAPQAPDTSL
jgi:filamentous hemagglutinin family protein